MKVLDLLCDADHRFEGWFASEEDFQSQLDRGLVECPMCGSDHIRKGLSAPRLNLRTPLQDHPPPHQASASDDSVAAATSRNVSNRASPMSAQLQSQLQEAWLRAARHVVANTENVGEQFAHEARRIHYGDAPERGIRGQASAEETAELLEEGIDVMPFVLPDSLKETLQ
ncbi:DUF1178 family protein [Diaphorobacter aerolatus]|uniref:DUF1178 family protein n=1 Tax=Diaphorobacter aerolatus TaxID=1288495 RepID=A0A7H0GIF6_9BURK|nr:DUF1178 family protein [Diaphorobacter aerolatus]QNP48072.1 DUF1178 family protein [Diaphorobacter aerolatus]